MSATIITTEDLYEFKIELLEDIKQLLLDQSGQITKKWIKSVEAKRVLGVSHGTLQNLRNNGTIPFSKIGGVLYYDYHQIMKILEDNRTQNGF